MSWITFHHVNWQWDLETSQTCWQLHQCSRCFLLHQLLWIGSHFANRENLKWTRKPMRSSDAFNQKRTNISVPDCSFFLFILHSFFILNIHSYKPDRLSFMQFKKFIHDPDSYMNSCCFELITWKLELWWWIWSLFFYMETWWVMLQKPSSYDIMQSFI